MTTPRSPRTWPTRGRPGTLATDPDDAWGNAAIPGFGIGRPVRAPSIDPAANPLPLATAEEAARTERTFEIAPETLVLAASARGAAADRLRHARARSMQRSQGRFLLGLLGAVAGHRLRDGLRRHAQWGLEP